MLGVQETPVVVEAAFLLYTLNEYLARTACLVQPLIIPPAADPADLPTLDIPLPLERDTKSDVTGVDPQSGERRDISWPHFLTAAAEELGLHQVTRFFSCFTAPYTQNL